jgi:hypothetical protein
MPRSLPVTIRRTGLSLCLLVPVGATASAADDPPRPLAADPPNPFETTREERTDAVDGAVHLSNGTVIRGKVYLTRGYDLRIYDAKREEFRNVPLHAVEEIACQVEKEWLEREWRFKENANDEKIYTGRMYPSRNYTHQIKLTRGDVISGPLGVVVYVAPTTEPAAESGPAKADDPPKPQRFMLHKRDKGEPGQTLSDLVYVQKIVLGAAAAANESPEKTAKPTPPE